MANKVTIADVAKASGSTISTVSRALNGSTLIGSKKAKEIIKIANDLGYVKRNIRKQKGRAILNIILILPQFKERSLHLFYDYSELLAGIKSSIQQNQVHLMTDLEDSLNTLNRYKTKGDIDGIIFAFTKPSTKVYQELEKKNIPHLTLNRILPQYDYIACENEIGMSKLVSILSKKHKQFRPCYIGLKSIPEINEQRLSGFKKGCSENKIIYKAEHILQFEKIEDITASIISSLISKGFNCIFCFNDVVAARISQCHSAKADTSIHLIGFDYSPVRELLSPRPDTMSLPIENMGKYAGQWIEKRIINRSDTPFQILISGTYISDH